MTSCAVYAPAKKHTEPGHPENIGRMEIIRSLLEEHGLFNQLSMYEPVPASVDQLSLAHHPRLIESIKRLSAAGGGRVDADTYCTPDSFELARVAAGSTCVLVDAILTGEADNGIALVRPPGHHAEQNRSMGFCLFNNVAIAARYAQENFNLNKVLIIDFDVHHGNGTQDVFYRDPSVLFISLHLFHPFFYPGTGGAYEVGEGDGSGFTINVPFRAGAGDYWYDRAFSELIWPAARRYQPDLILVSAGFDAHWQDPLAAARLSLGGYAAIARHIVRMAEELCLGRLLLCLEGGYHYEALSHGVLNSIEALLGSDKVIDPLGSSPSPEVDMSKVLATSIQLHLPEK